MNSRKQARTVSDSSNIIQTEVLIIGAGISGLEAARLLREQGVKTIILEARNRTGGRIWSIRSETGHMLDMGAAWIHGINGGIHNGLLSNPLWDLTQEANISTRPTQADDFQVIYPREYDQTDNFGQWFDDYMNFVREETRLSSSNTSFGYYADLFVQKTNFTENQKNIFYSLLHYYLENNEGARINEIGAKGFLDITTVHYGDEHIFHQDGFMSLTNYLTKYAGEIQLEKIVTEINYNNRFVQVLTNDGKIYQSEFVLVTVPLGVLKSKEILFNPQLPQWKLDAIDRLGYGLLEKIILVWDQPWWNSTNFYFMRVSSKTNHFGYWVNLNKWNDKPVLICFFAGQSDYREELIHDKDQIIEDITITLQEMFPNINIPSPVESILTKWYEDPFSYGAYSYVSVNQQYADPTYLAEPIGNRLLFAGEATSQDSYGYAHGAVLTARREVTRLLYAYDLLP